MNLKDVEKAESDGVRHPLRADARRNLDLIMQAAMEVFSERGVDAPIRAIAERARVGVGTLYRHFPERSDLIKAIIRRDVDAQVKVGEVFAASNSPDDALSLWMSRLVDFVGTKRHLGPALHSGDPAYQALPTYVLGELTPVLRNLLQAAADSGSVRNDVEPDDLLVAAMRLAVPQNDGDAAQAKRMVQLLVDGLYRSAQGHAR